MDLIEARRCAPTSRRFKPDPVPRDGIGRGLGHQRFARSGRRRQGTVAGASVYPCVQNLLRALREEGLGAALTTLLAPAEEEVRQLLALPEDVALAAHIGVGYREDAWPGRLARRPVEEFAFLD